MLARLALATRCSPSGTAGIVRSAPLPLSSASRESPHICLSAAQAAVSSRPRPLLLVVTVGILSTPPPRLLSIPRPSTSGPRRRLLRDDKAIRLLGGRRRRRRRRGRQHLKGSAHACLRKLPKPRPLAETRRERPAILVPASTDPPTSPEWARDKSSPEFERFRDGHRPAPPNGPPAP